MERVRIRGWIDAWERIVDNSGIAVMWDTDFVTEFRFEFVSQG